jgi:hypothetical protein
MTHNYFQVSIRVAAFFVMLAGFTLLAKPHRVFAFETCTECEQQCSHQRVVCFDQCRAEGLDGCELACNPQGITCQVQCTEAGLCP